VATKRDRDAEPRRQGLGKPLATYGTEVKATVFITLAVFAGLAGGATVGASTRLARSLADSRDGTPYAVVGWCLVVLGMVSVAYGVFHLGLSFQVCRGGVRLRRRRLVTEIPWDEVQHIEVFKTNLVYRGAKQRTDWEVFIHGRYHTIHLTKAFLHLVRSVPGILGLLKMHSGQQIDMPVEFNL
jgi:hypothetical protein